MSDRSRRHQGRAARPVFPQMTCDLPHYELEDTPSRRHGLTPDLEAKCRSFGCEVIQSTGILLKCSQVIMACAQILFQRYFCRQSLLTHRPEYVALGCLFLASKVEEDKRRLRHLINTSRHVLFTMTTGYKEGQVVEPLELGGDSYHDMKNGIIKAERRVLKELGFCVHLHHPHKLIVSIQGVLKIQHEVLGQRAWNYMNDSLRTSVFLEFPQEVIACACIDLAAEDLGISLPPTWLELFNAPKSSVEKIRSKVRAVYTWPKLFYDTLLGELCEAADAIGSSIFNKRSAMFNVVAAGSTVRRRRLQDLLRRKAMDESQHSSEHHHHHHNNNNNYSHSHSHQRHHQSSHQTQLPPPPIPPPEHMLNKSTSAHDFAEEPRQHRSHHTSHDADRRERRARSRSPIGRSDSRERNTHQRHESHHRHHRHHRHHSSRRHGDRRY